MAIAIGGNTNPNFMAASPLAQSCKSQAMNLIERVQRQDVHGCPRLKCKSSHMDGNSAVRSRVCANWAEAFEVQEGFRVGP